MGDAACIKRAAEIVAASARESVVVVVVSAMGGVTNRLVAAARSSVEGDREAAEKLADDLVAVDMIITVASRQVSEGSAKVMPA